MSRVARVVVVLGGYAASFGAAYAAVYLHNVTANLDPADASGGMAAFGDLILFCGVFGVCALVPTALAVLWFLRSVRWRR